MTVNLPLEYNYTPTEIIACTNAVAHLTECSSIRLQRSIISQFAFLAILWYTIFHIISERSLHMCTAATYQTNAFYFGRTLDYESSYGEEIVILPRKYKLPFLHMGVSRRLSRRMCSLASAMLAHWLRIQGINSYCATFFRLSGSLE